MKKILHIGLHNTGTTWLQKCFFPLIKDFDIISNEDLSGLPWQGHKVEYRYALIYGLKKLYPDAKIIIGLREKTLWVKALHSHYVKRGGCKSFNDWYNNVFDHRLEDFDKYLLIINELFDDVFIYDFKDFKDNKKILLKDICNFIGCTMPSYNDIVVNKGFKGRLLKLGLLVNKGIGKIRYLLEMLNNDKMRC